MPTWKTASFPAAVNNTPLSRLMGMETEYVMRYSPRSNERPLKTTVYEFMEATLVARLDGAPSHEGYFLGNGGAISFEFRASEPNSGLLEMATPECAGPAQLLLYQRAQDRLLEEALPCAQEQLKGKWHYHGSLGLIKNCRDAKGELYGVQENYQAVASRGHRLLARKLLIIPLALLGFLPLALHGALWTILCLLCTLFRVDESKLIPLEAQMCKVGITLSALFNRPLNLLFEATCFVEIRRLLTTFLMTRTILIGAGTLNPDGTFELSERAGRMDSICDRTLSADGRPVFRSGNLVKQTLQALLSLSGFDILFRSEARLQLGSSEANMCERAEYLKLATTCLVLDMIESGFLKEAPQLKDPLATLKAVSKDLTLRQDLELQDGSRSTALELQRWYLEQARVYLQSQPIVSIEGAQILKIWDETLSLLESDPPQLFGALDWVTKRILLSKAQDEPIEVRKKIDIKYHELGCGYLRTLEQEDLVERMLTEEDVLQAMREPPAETPALARTQAIRRLAGFEALFSWEHATIGKSFQRKVIPFTSRD
jgi:Pup amidohydrolase